MKISNSIYKTAFYSNLNDYRNFIYTPFFFAHNSIFLGIEDVIGFKLNNKTIAEVVENLSVGNKKFVIENYNKIPVDSKLIQLYQKKCEEALILSDFVSLDFLSFIEVSYLGLEIVRINDLTIKLIILLPNTDIATYIISKEDDGPVLVVNSVEFSTRTDISLFIINGLSKYDF